MLLIDQPALAVDTAIVFDVTLENGQKPIRAEARVVGHVEPTAEQPGGLRVRFRRFGAATKAFIDRAVNGTAPALVLEVSAEPVVNVEQASSQQQVESAAASGVHRKAVLPVAAPVNREALLARLRGRRAG